MKFQNQLHASLWLVELSSGIAQVKCGPYALKMAHLLSLTLYSLVVTSVTISNDYRSGNGEPLLGGADWIWDNHKLTGP